MSVVPITLEIVRSAVTSSILDMEGLEDCRQGLHCTHDGEDLHDVL